MVKMRAVSLKDFNLTEGQKKELAQLLKLESLVSLEQEEYYVMKGYHLISWFETMMKMQGELDKLKND